MSFSNDHFARNFLYKILNLVQFCLLKSIHQICSSRLSQLKISIGSFGIIVLANKKKYDVFFNLKHKIIMLFFSAFYGVFMNLFGVELNQIKMKKTSLFYNKTYFIMILFYWVRIKVSVCFDLVCKPIFPFLNKKSMIKTRWFFWTRWLKNIEF